MTRTTEQLKQRIAEIQQLARELKWQGASGVESAQLALEDAESLSELLAVREAQPVKVPDSITRVTVKTLKQIIGHEECDEYSPIESILARQLLFWESGKFYTAPPAPAVPDWKHISNEWADVATSALVWLKNIADGISTPEVAIKNTELGIAACRAAMLQPFSQGYTLPDTWNNCKEKQPDTDGAYWCWFGKENPSSIQQRACVWNARNSEWCDSSVTHWQPLAAAPTHNK